MGASSSIKTILTYQNKDTILRHLFFRVRRRATGCDENPCDNRILSWINLIFSLCPASASWRAETHDLWNMSVFCRSHANEILWLCPTICSGCHWGGYGALLFSCGCTAISKIDARKWSLTTKACWNYVTHSEDKKQQHTARGTQLGTFGIFKESSEIFDEPTETVHRLCGKGKFINLINFDAKIWS